MESFDRALQYGEYWRFLTDRARVRIAMKQYAEAIQDLNKAIRLRPQNTEVLLKRGETFCHLNQIQEAVEDFKLVALLDPASTELKESRAWAAQNLVATAFDLHKKKRMAESIAMFQQALELNASHRDAYYYRATVYAENGRLDLAKRDLEKSIQLDPRHYDSYVAMDWVLFRNRGLDTIVSYWNQYIELEPNNAKAYLERSGTYYHKKDFQSASRDAKEACDLGNQEGCQRYRQVSQKISGR